MKETVYLITDRYEHAEFYDFYGKGIYSSEDEATADLKKEYFEFVKYGPDDCHTFRLTKHTLLPEVLAQLKKYYEAYRESQSDSAKYDVRYMNDFTDFMEKLMNLSSTVVLFESDGCSDALEIVEKAEANGEDFQDDAVFAKYFDEIWNKPYKDPTKEPEFFCPDCGTKVTKDADKCPKCGCEFDNEE